jgi:hypothetical protein
MKGLGAGVIAVGLALGCGGLGESVVWEEALEEAPPEPEPAAPVAVEAPPALLVFTPKGAVCAWTVQSIGGGARELALTESCPEVVWFAPDGARVVAWGGGRTWHGPISSLVMTEAPVGVETAWPVDGKPALGAAIYAEDRITVRTFMLGGSTFMPSGDHPVDIEPGFGDPLAVHPTQPLDAGWQSLAQWVDEAPSKGGEVADASPAARAAVQADSDRGVGQIPVGDQVLTFAVITGDTPHPSPPLVWCAEADCAAATPLVGEWPAQVAALPRGELVLVVEEYSGRQPALYRAGVAEPIFVGAPGARAVWAPRGL